MQGAGELNVRTRSILAGLALTLVACGGKGPATPARISRAALLDPESCRSCHPGAYDDWAMSMHASAADDPVFRAMNARGQRETAGALGPFCINCHAPMAVREGATRDGLNLDQVAAPLKGVTCFFCHSVDAVTGSHDAALQLATDGVMRGGISDPLASAPHGSAYSALHDRDKLASAQLCGACHDIRTGHGADIERTFAEWRGSAFAQPTVGTSCGQCHMPRSTAPTPIATTKGAPPRHAHGHAFPAVDISLTDPALAATQRARVEELLATTVQSALCVATGGPGPRIAVILDNAGSGHAFPSGSAQDRRFWAEVTAFADGGAFYQSGGDPDGGAIVASTDPDLWLLRDCMFDAAGKEVSMFWEAASTEGNALPALATFDTQDPRYYQTHALRLYPDAAPLSQTPDRVTLRLLLEPLGREVMGELVATHDLAPEVAQALPRYVLGPAQTLTWTAASATASFIDGQSGEVFTCVSPSGLNVNAATIPAPRRTRCRP